MQRNNPQEERLKMPKELSGENSGESNSSTSRADQPRGPRGAIRGRRVAIKDWGAKLLFRAHFGCFTRREGAAR
jgi:hypothetical protein